MAFDPSTEKWYTSADVVELPPGGLNSSKMVLQIDPGADHVEAHFWWRSTQSWVPSTDPEFIFDEQGFVSLDSIRPAIKLVAIGDASFQIHGRDI